MPATSFAVDYSLATGRVRGWALFNDKAETDGHLAVHMALPLPKGVGRLSFSITQYGDQTGIQALVTAKTGIPFPPADAHDCFDAQGNYIVTVSCDPAGCGDGPPPGATTMINSVGAKPGATYKNGTYTPAPTPVVTGGKGQALAG